MIKDLNDVKQNSTNNFVHQNHSNSKNNSFGNLSSFSTEYEKSLDKMFDSSANPAKENMFKYLITIAYFLRKTNFNKITSTHCLANIRLTNPSCSGGSEAHLRGREDR